MRTAHLMLLELLVMLLLARGLRGSPRKQPDPQDLPARQGPDPVHLAPNGPPGPTGPTGPAGPQGEQGPPSPTVRVVRSNCLTGECTVTCRGTEILVTAYCGPTHNRANFIGERQASCGVEATAADTPLVAVCVAAPP